MRELCDGLTTNTVTRLFALTFASTSTAQVQHEQLTTFANYPDAAAGELVRLEGAEFASADVPADQRGRWGDFNLRELNEPTYSTQPAVELVSDAHYNGSGMTAACLVNNAHRISPLTPVCNAGLHGLCNSCYLAGGVCPVCAAVNPRAPGRVQAHQQHVNPVP